MEREHNLQQSPDNISHHMHLKYLAALVCESGN